MDQNIFKNAKNRGAGAVKSGSDSLVVVLLLLLPPVLVELMDFNGHIPLLCHIKSLQKKHYTSTHTKTRVLHISLQYYPDK